MNKIQFGTRNYISVSEFPKQQAWIDVFQSFLFELFKNRFLSLLNFPNDFENRWNPKWAV